MIPEAAIEAAAKWLHDNNCRSALHSGFPADFECYDWLDEAKELLEVAAPHMTPSGDASAVIAELRLFNHHKAADLMGRQLESATEANQYRYPR